MEEKHVDPWAGTPPTRKARGEARCLLEKDSPGPEHNHDGKKGLVFAVFSHVQKRDNPRRVSNAEGLVNKDLRPIAKNFSLYRIPILRDDEKFPIESATSTRAATAMMNIDS